MNFKTLWLAITVCTVACVGTASALTCKEFQRGYLLTDIDVLKSAAQLMVPVAIAESNNIPTEPQLRGFFWMGQMSRLNSLCQNLPDETIESLTAAMVKAAASQETARKEAAAAQPQSPTAGNSLEDLRTLQRQSQPPKGHSNPQDGAASNGGGSGANDLSGLTASQLGAIGDFVRRCWSTDPGMPDLERMEVLLTVTTDGGGIVRRVVVAQNDANRVRGNPRLRIFAERAVRATLDPNCANLPLPQPMLGQTRVFTFAFRP